MRQPILIGIAGGTGSGKTTLVEALMKRFEGDITLLCHDNYYRAHNEIPYEERCKLNYDHPDAFETELMVAHLQELKQGRDILCPVYDYTVHNRSEKVIPVQAKPVILVEGILIFADPALCRQLDIKLFVDTDADVRLCRRIRRDVRDRGRTVDSVIDQYLTTVKPMHEQFVEPSRKNADLVIPEGGHNLVALDMIIERIRRHLHGLDDT
ncbi:MAG: uridine kinase [Lachnospiraceae bacterium]|nr:uridine kinase [Lachnospiraceae bacterium]MCD8123801.1 uridine kinase [Lachnospiraceae bacterium]